MNTKIQTETRKKIIKYLKMVSSPQKISPFSLRQVSVCLSNDQKKDRRGERRELANVNHFIEHNHVNDFYREVVMKSFPILSSLSSFFLSLSLYFKESLPTILEPSSRKSLP